MSTQLIRILSWKKENGVERASILLIPPPLVSLKTLLLTIVEQTKRRPITADDEMEEWMELKVMEAWQNGQMTSHRRHWISRKQRSPKSSRFPLHNNACYQARIIICIHHKWLLNLSKSSHILGLKVRFDSAIDKSPEIKWKGGRVGKNQTQAVRTEASCPAFIQFIG